MEQLADNRNASPAHATRVSDRPVAEVSSEFVSPANEPSSAPLPSRSQRRHAAAEESFERSLLLLFVLLALLGGVAVFAEVTVPQRAPAPLLEIPNLNAARSLEEAREMVGGNFFIEDVQVESGEPVGNVVSQDPKPGELAEEGATISVRISGRQIEALPDVEGQTIEEATQSIRSRPFGLEVKTAESSSREIGRVIEQEPEGGDGETAEAGTYVTVTVGTGPPAAKIPALRAPLPEETRPAPGNQKGTPNYRGSSDRNAEQRPPTATVVKPDDQTGYADEPGPHHTQVPDTAAHDYASWLEESEQYDPQESAT